MPLCVRVYASHKVALLSRLWSVVNSVCTLSLVLLVHITMSMTSHSAVPVMHRVGEYEYSSGSLLGHGAFALVFQGRRVKV